MGVKFCPNKLTFVLHLFFKMYIDYLHIIFCELCFFLCSRSLFIFIEGYLCLSIIISPFLLNKMQIFLQVNYLFFLFVCLFLLVRG